VRLATLARPGEPPATRWSVLRAVAFSPDGSLALVGFPDGAVGVWGERGSQMVAWLETVDGSRLIAQPFVRDTQVSSLAISPDHRWLFAGHADTSATIWDVRTRDVVFAARDHAEDILAVFDTADGFGWATTAGAVWQARGDEPPAKLLDTGEHWAEARFEGRRLLTRGSGDEITLWDLADGSDLRLVSEVPASRGWADTAATLDVHGEWLLYPQGGTRVVVRRGAEAFVIERDAQLVTARFSPDGTAFATEGWNPELELWAIPGGALVRTFPAPGGVGEFAFSLDGARIAIGEIGNGGGRYPRPLSIYDVATGERTHVHTEHQWQIAQVELSPDGTCVASLADDIVLWDLDRHCVTARIAAIQPRSTAAFRFLPDGRLLVLDQGRARIYRGDTMLLEWPAPIGFRTRWCVGHGARTLCVALAQAVVRFDLETGSVRGTWAAPIARPDRVPGADLARQLEARVAAALWRTDHGRFLHQGDGPRGWVQPLALSPDGVVVVPAKAGAAILRLDEADATVLGHVAFEGKLRASRVVDGLIVLVNDQGRVFRHALPDA
jgi:WD40 repeat protein